LTRDDCARALLAVAHVIADAVSPSTWPDVRNRSISGALTRSTLSY